MTNEERQVIDDYLQIHLGPKGPRLVEIAERALNNQRNLYHVSVDANLKFFYPRVSKKLYPNETTQIPRTSTSPSLIQCILGYGGFYQDTRYRDDNFNGIYHVYCPEWEVAFRPSKSLVGDVKYTDEHWLLYYQKEHYKRPCTHHAEFFVKRISSLLKGEDHIDEYEVFLKVDKDNFEVLPGKGLKRGFYRLTLQNFKTPDYDYRLDENLFIELIDSKQYQWSYAIRTNKIGK